MTSRQEIVKVQVSSDNMNTDGQDRYQVTKRESGRRTESDARALGLYERVG